MLSQPFASPPGALSATHRIFLSRGYFPLLDGLRCLSIVAVVWFHAAGGTFTGILSRGNQGVSLFFVISGFLITTILLREQSTTGDISLQRFYLRRTFRIFPLYYAMLALYVVLVIVAEKQPAVAAQFWHNLPFFLTYTSNWFVPFDSGRIIFNGGAILFFLALGCKSYLKAAGPDRSDVRRARSSLWR
jgi:peptidoglycan/LPS O-acetylase OafA/YrhL